MLPKINTHRNYLSAIGKTKNIELLSSRRLANNGILSKAIVDRNDRSELAFIPTFDESDFHHGGNKRVDSSHFLPMLRLLNASATAITDDDLKELANNRGLIKVVLEDCHNLIDVSSLSYISTLEEIHLRGCSKVSSIGGIGRLPMLWLLDLSQTAVTANDLKGLRESRSLVKIRLDDCKNLNAVNCLSCITSVEEIYIRGCKNVKHIGSLGLLSTLHTLDVSKMPITNEGLLGIGASCGLERIFLGDCKLLSNVSTLSSIRTLREVSLSGCVRLESVGVLGVLPSLCLLDVSKTSLTDEGLDGLSVNNSLRKIILDDCVRLTNVSELSFIKSLKEIYLTGCISISGVGVLGVLPSLCVLDVSKTSLTDEGLDGLSVNRSLEKIILDDCARLTNVSELSSIMSLRDVRLRGCNKMTGISGLGSLPELDSLDLSMTAVTSRSLSGLGASPSLSKIFLEDCWNLTSVHTLSSILTLEEIYLRGCIRVTDVGALGTLPVLCLLDVSKTSVTDEGLDGLSASPTLKRILLEDCTRINTIAALASIHTISEVNVCGCSGVKSFLSTP
ncbi:leucine-rich repeat protein 1 (LRRP1) [Trypanosoma cruzi cruzi]|uniref:Putative leucine-rich repeat protein 1 (LRRP1) n=1 Tax=Trypanosoma cruzi TaxID=5693 RepID=A0A2V2V7J1_TRYCR|nr:leucine-rich repeat protein 1 (LRRP1) [Trypanosoma cruzi cruzi]PWU92319.1 putative leucine-rich repeat protein 1 (LRRP1) [Trypanosoma cruzi]